MPGPGLPADVAQAYRRGNAVVLLIVKEGATDDDLVRDSVGQISRSGVSVFVAPAERCGSLLADHPGRGRQPGPGAGRGQARSTGGQVPQATVSYGFRSTASVVQAVDDALYQGPDDVPYHPG